MNIPLINNTSLSSLWGTGSKTFNVSTGSDNDKSTEAANSASNSSSSQNGLLRILKTVNEHETTLENGDGDTAQISDLAMSAAQGMPSGAPPGPPPSQNGNNSSSENTTDTSNQSIVELLNSDDDDDDDDDDSLQALLERAANGTADAADLQKLAMLLEQKAMTKDDKTEKKADDVNNEKDLDSKTIFGANLEGV